MEIGETDRPSLGRAWSDLLGRKRIYTGCGILLVLEVAVFLFMVAGTHGLIVPLPKPVSTDFVSFYAAGSLANSGTPELAYDREEHYAAEQRATEAGIQYNYFYYPPTFLLLCAALAHLPYICAFLVFEGLTLCLYLFVARRVLGESELLPLVPLAAFPPVLWTLGVGQNALLTASLLGAATLLVDRRPILAGFLFGALCYKPHFGLLVPVALIAGGRWRALTAAFGSAALLCLLSLILFGWTAWDRFLTAAVAAHAVYDSGGIPAHNYINPFGATLLLGGARSIAYSAQAGAAAAAALLVALVWRRGLPLPLRAATLISATLIAVPLALFYEMTLAAIAAAWLLRAAKEDPLDEWEKIALLGLFVLTINTRGPAEIWHVPVGPLVALAFFAFVTIRVTRAPEWSRAVGIRKRYQQPTAVQITPGPANLRF
jgi:alpha-1,2-mannosyltransferase